MKRTRVQAGLIDRLLDPHKPFVLNVLFLGLCKQNSSYPRRLYNPRHRGRLFFPRKAAAVKDEEGSIILEAAIVMPVLLLFLVLLAAFVQFSAAETALQAAADQTARQTAAQIRPALLLMQQGGNAASSGNPAEAPPPQDSGPGVSPANPPQSRLQLPDWRQAAAGAAAYLPEPAGTIAASVLEGDWKALADMAAEPVGIAIFEPLLRKAAEGTPLEPSRIRLASLSLPDLNGGEQAFLKLEAEYEFPLKVPFLGKKIILHRTAAERVWIPDPLPAEGRADSATDPAGAVTITKLNPVPARPGRTATLEAIASPGAQVTLEVRYKSGSSISKNVGTRTADASGHVEWTWLVSGNTTAGQWEVIVTTSDGASDSMPFTVQKQTGPVSSQI